MNVVGKQFKLLLSHRRIREHPIFDPSYARENLVCLGETFVMLYFYYAIFALVSHLFVVMGYLGEENLLWLIIEGSVRGLALHLPDALFYNKTAIGVAIGLTVVAAILVRLSFEIIKANLHPAKKGRLKAKNKLVVE